MATCDFCRRTFQSGQGVKAHLKHCDRYKIRKNKKARALGNEPKAAVTPAATPPVQSSPPVAAPDLAAPLRDFMKSLSELSTKRDAPQTPQQQRREIIQAAKTQVIDHYWTPLGQVTDSMRGVAKMEIERKLATLPLEELRFEEVCEFAAAIRDGCYSPAFTRQAREAKRQRLEREKHQKDELEALGALRRADRRKKILIQQASHQAQASCDEKAITGWAQLSVLGDIESRLGAFLTGDEPIIGAQAIVCSVLAARFAEAEATLAAARAKAAEQWREEVAAVLVLVGLLAAPLLALRYPAQALAILSWIEKTFGIAPGAEAGAPTPDASETTPPAASAEPRPSSKRRRKDPVVTSSPESPWGNSVGGEPAHA